MKVNKICVLIIDKVEILTKFISKHQEYVALNLCCLVKHFHDFKEK